MKRKRQSGKSTVSKSKGKGSKKNKQAVVKYVVKDGEMKQVDYLNAAQDITASYNANTGIWHMNIVSSGNAGMNRNDSTIYMKAIQLKLWHSWYFKHELVTDNMYGLYKRVVLIYDRYPQGSIPNWDVIFTDIKFDSTSSSDMYSHLNNNERDRFVIIRDWFHEANADYEITKGTFGGQSVKYTSVQAYIPLDNLITKFKYQSTTGTIGDIEQGALYLAVRTSRSTVEHKTETAVNARITFSEA